MTIYRLMSGGKPSRLYYAIIFCALILRVASASSIFEIVPGRDCSTNISCSELHEAHWDRPTCAAKILARQRQEPNFHERYGNEEFFLVDNGNVANRWENMIVTMRGCNEFCGPKTFYWDAIPRVTTWVIPVVLILSNIELSPIDKRRFMTIIHAVGDPIDSFWSILHKMYVWRRLYAIAMSRCLQKDGKEAPQPSIHILWRERFKRWHQRWRRWLKTWWRRIQYFVACLVLQVSWNQKSAHREAAMEEMRRRGSEDSDSADGNISDYNAAHGRARIIATVLAGFEEIGGAEISSEVHYMMLMDQLGHIGLPDQSEGAWKQWRHCARVLADARTNELSRTLLAIFIYVFNVVAALYENIGGGNTSKPGGRIGSAVFLMWLVPLALLSNTVGTFTSRRTCLTIMRQFVEKAREAMKEEKRHMIQQVASRSPRSPLHRQHDSGSVEPLDLLPNAAWEAENRPESTTSVDASHLTPPQPAHSPKQHKRKPRSLSFGSTTEIGSPGSRRAPATPSSLMDMKPKTRHARTGSKKAREPNSSIGSVSQIPEAFELDLAPSTSPPSQVYQPRSPRSDAETMNLSPCASGTMEPAISPYIAAGDGGTQRPLLGSPEMRRSPQFNDPFGQQDGNGYKPIAQETPRLENGDMTGRGVVRVSLLPETSWDQYFSWLQPLGAIYTYRPWKIGYRSVSEKTHAHYTSNWYLFFIGLIPVAVSAIGAFIIMWYAVPTGWSCRHTWVLGLTVLWLASVGCTTFLHTGKRRELSGRVVWVLVVVKDAIIGIGGLALVFLSTSGVFNSCYCWSAYMWHRFLPGDWGREAFVPLNIEDKYSNQAANVYTPVVFASLGAQFAFFALVVLLWWDGIYVVRWNEERCCREWRHEVAHGSSHIQYDETNYLVFWYDKNKYDDQELSRQGRNSVWTAQKRASSQLNSPVSWVSRRRTNTQSSPGI